MQWIFDIQILYLVRYVRHSFIDQIVLAQFVLLIYFQPLIVLHITVNRLSVIQVRLQWLLESILEILALRRVELKFDRFEDEKFIRNFLINPNHFLQIKNLYIHEDYRGKQHGHRDDIALVEVEPFQLTERVQLICIDWSNYYEHLDFQDGRMGVVSIIRHF